MPHTPNQVIDPEEVLTIRQAARIANLHRSTVWDAATEGHLSARKDKGRFLTTRGELDAWLKRRANPESESRTPVAAKDA